MKLIALIVEQYRNVFEKQVFNFSDEYKVDFDWNTRELTVEKNEDYIPNFYGDKIYNITPIVGINGTGKSSLAHLIGYYYKDGDRSVNEYSIHIYHTKDNELVYFSKNDISLKNNNFFQVIKKTSSINERTLIKSIGKARDKSRGTFDGGGGGINVEYNLDSFPPIFQAYDELKNRKIVTSELQLYLRANSYRLSNFIEEYSFQAKTIDEFLEEVFICHIVKLYEELKDKISIDNVKNLIEKENYSVENYIDNILSEESGLEIENSSTEIFQTLKILRKILETWDFESVKGTYAKNNYLKYDASQKNIFEKGYKAIKEYQKILSNNQIYASDLFSEIDISMSFGEKNYIELYAHILSAVENIVDNFDDVIFVIDEIELGLHLEWSRKLIKFLIDSVRQKYFDKYSIIIEEHWKNYGVDREINYDINFDFPNFQFIFTTHSPYMLSDIKPGNVIALKRNEETGFSEVQDYQNTFAKNIQEIMADDMFVKNVYGDFAIWKINDLIAKLSSDGGQSSGEPQKLKKEINLIAEPVLRNKLLDMYFKKYGERDKLAEFEQAFRVLTSEERRELREKLLTMEEN